jgi:hypothetical protein
MRMMQVMGEDENPSKATQLVDTIFLASPRWKGTIRGG